MSTEQEYKNQSYEDKMTTEVSQQKQIICIKTCWSLQRKLHKCS